MKQTFSSSQKYVHSMDDKLHVTKAPTL